ncbi:MAG: glucose 1-dehydrogenase [Bacteroidetes bacterium]|nr:MAG: glucose 1-dehydrogenase [Bacteroidota bacterium]TAG88805.1 MAG: glucose 1-dehydrogenase [Bacteroidota bacterium]
MEKKFSNKVALITGAAAGIGKETAIQFAKLGAKIILSDINETEGQKITELIKELGQEAHFFKCDVADAKQVTDLLNFTNNTYQRLDFAVNNAGISGKLSPTINYPIDEYLKVIAINQNGVFYGMQEQLKIMLPQKSGCIVNIASVAGLRGMPMSSPYAASKHAVIGLTKSVALEMASKNIRVNAVCPVFTLTNMVESMFIDRPDFEEKLRLGIPMKRYGTVTDVANQIIWLCSDESSFITGQSLSVDGGIMAS